jgi:LmbE family N-acetylglucosaminyl deacetylase
MWRHHRATCADGDDVHMVIMAEGLTSRSTFDGTNRREELSALAQAAHAANAVLGVSELTLLQLPDNRMDSVDRLDVIKAVESKMADFAPDRIYTHHAGDVNIDHRIIHEAVNTACRPLPGHSVRGLLYFEVASSTEWQIPGSAPAFLPNWFVDITETLPSKIEALHLYESEMRDWPHPRSFSAVEHLARWRGATVGTQAAESFMLGRLIL